jgi:hypothetical protein
MKTPYPLYLLTIIFNFFQQCPGCLNVLDRTDFKDGIGRDKCPCRSKPNIDDPPDTAGPFHQACEGVPEAHPWIFRALPIFRLPIAANPQGKGRRRTSEDK